MSGESQRNEENIPHLFRSVLTAMPSYHCHTWIGQTQWAYSVQLANLTHGVHWEAQQQAGRGEGGSGVEGTGVEWRAGQGRAGQGRAGQGRVPDCLGGLSRVGISSRSTRPWNGQPPSLYYDWGNNIASVIAVFRLVDNLMPSRLPIFTDLITNSNCLQTQTVTPAYHSWYVLFLLRLTNWKTKRYRVDEAASIISSRSIVILSCLVLCTGQHSNEVKRSGMGRMV